MSKPAYKRSARVSDQMREEIADILARKIKDPRVPQGMITVTEVALSDDLRNAKIFFSSLSGKREDILKGLASAAPFIRAELGRRLRLKFVPEILFRYDEAMERGSHIMDILHRLEEEKKAEEKDAEDE